MFRHSGKAFRGSERCFLAWSRVCDDRNRSLEGGVVVQKGRMKIGRYAEQSLERETCVDSLVFLAMGRRSGVATVVDVVARTTDAA